MADGTKIEWTDATWNPITGCSVLSAGCKHCYAMKLAGTRMQHHPSRAGLTIQTKAGPVWNGQVRFNAEWLAQPLHWAKPRMIFVNAHGDTFHEAVETAWIDRILAVAALARHHVFQVLTKRSDRMRAYFADPAWKERVASLLEELKPSTNWNGNVYQAKHELATLGYLPNVWLGVSVEDQDNANARVPDLLATPAAVRWLSAEPLLGPIDLRTIVLRRDGSKPTELSNRLGDYVQPLTGNFTDSPRIHWVVAGGESDKGPRARPMHPAWVNALRDQCEAAGVAFLFKQWGDWHPVLDVVGAATVYAHGKSYTGQQLHRFPDGTLSIHTGKALAGRALAGRTHDGLPA